MGEQHSGCTPTVTTGELLPATTILHAYTNDCPILQRILHREYTGMGANSENAKKLRERHGCITAQSQYQYEGYHQSCRDVPFVRLHTNDMHPYHIQHVQFLERR